jgi:hypothetical protein
MSSRVSDRCTKRRPISTRLRSATSGRIFNDLFNILMSFPISPDKVLFGSKAVRLLERRATPWSLSIRQTDRRNPMELSITQNGALYALQHGANKKYRRVRRSRRVGADLIRLLPSLTTSVEKLMTHAIPIEMAQFALQRNGAQVADSFPEYRVAA